MSRQKVISGQAPTQNQQMWLELGRQLSNSSIDAIEETAKNLVAGLTILEGLYFGAVSFENVYDHIDPIAQYLGIDNWLVALLFGAPIVIWLFSASAATIALTVKRHDLQLDDPALLERQIKAIASGKYRWVRASLYLLLVGLLVLSANLVLYLSI